MSTSIVVKCKNCEKDFNYAKKELNRQIKRGRTINDLFCSRSCVIIFNNAHLSDEQRRMKSIQKSKSNKGNTYAKKGNFTYYLNKAKSRDPNMNIDDAYLEQLWINQSDKCSLSNIKIHLKNGKHKLNTASLDRIDSSKGYIKGNVQFVAYAINLAKNTFSDNELLEFLQEVKSA